MNGLRPPAQKLCFLLMRPREESVLSLSVSRSFLCSFHCRHLPFSAHISPALPVVPPFINTFVVTSLNPPGESRILPHFEFHESIPSVNSSFPYKTASSQDPLIRMYLARGDVLVCFLWALWKYQEGESFPERCPL